MEILMYLKQDVLPYIWNAKKRDNFQLSQGRCHHYNKFQSLKTCFAEDSIKHWNDFAYMKRLSQTTMLLSEDPWISTPIVYHLFYMFSEVSIDSPIFWRACCCPLNILTKNYKIFTKDMNLITEVNIYIWIWLKEHL